VECSIQCCEDLKISGHSYCIQANDQCHAATALPLKVDLWLVLLSKQDVPIAIPNSDGEKNSSITAMNDKQP
jgi:hypothetical protein